LEVKPRIGLRHPRLGATGADAAEWLATRLFARAGIHRLGSDVADRRIKEARDNMRLLAHFNQAWFADMQQCAARLRLWMAPVPVGPIGAAWLFAHLADASGGAPLTLAFCCRLPPLRTEVEASCLSGSYAEWLSRGRR
jgi:hypothetical protein